MFLCLPHTAKKNLAPSAMAGLAASVDFSVVKLRKTPASQLLLTDQAGSSAVGESAAGAGAAPGTDLDTSHPVMLIVVKGEGRTRHSS